MTLLDVAEKQNIIIQLQSDLITDLCKQLAQHTDLDNIEAELLKIKALKEEIERE